MPRLLSRQKFIPNGFKFYDANLKWTAPANASFAVICDGLRNARLANPGITAAKGLNTDPNAIAEEVDFFNASICQQMGWTDFISGGSGGAASVPFTPPQLTPRPPYLRQLKNVVAGSEVIIEWIATGAEAVPSEQANSRAATCVKCPKNGRGGFETWFTVPVSNAIRAALNQRGEMKLETPYDGELGVCTACDCPMKLKVHVPFDKFFPKMSQASKDALNKENPTCWIISESEK